MAIPQQPQPPTLINDGARRPDSLEVTWPNAVGAQSYNARITDEDGNTTTLTNVPRPLTFGGLSPTERYVMAVQAENADGVSPFSNNFATRTRPETPPAPTILQDAIMPVFLVKWSISGPAGGFSVLRRTGNGPDQIVVSNGPLTGEKAFSSIPSGLTWQFLSQIVVPQADMPGGVNESFWSTAAQVTTVEAVSSSPALRRTFGKLRLLRRR